MKKFLSIVLVLALLSTHFCGVSLPLVAQAQTNTPTNYQYPSEYTRRLFAASFEGNSAYVDKTAKESYEGKAPYKTTESLANLFDGDTATKYLTTFAADGSCYLQIKLSVATQVETYLIASANDFPERDPYAWTLYGSVNGTQWATVDTQDGVVFDNRYESQVFTADAPGSYYYYKLVVTKTYSSATGTANAYLSFSELMLNPTLDSGSGYVETVTKESYQGKTPHKTTESIANLFDGDTATKYLTAFAADNSCYVQVKLTEATQVDTYLIASANDYPERDPYAWTLYGSNDGSSWTSVDSRSAVVFAARHSGQQFTVQNPGTYSYYKLVISQTYSSATGTANAYLQFSEWILNPALSAESTNEPDLVTGTVYGSLSNLTMTTATAAGGSVGSKALQVKTTQPAGKTGSGSMVLYEDVNVKVTENTYFSYTIRPESASGYDVNYPGHYMALDLVFTDGTRLSGYELPDQNGHEVTPKAQGETQAMITSQWNYIRVDLATLKGKTIDKILVGYEHDSASSALNGVAYFDDVRICDEEAPAVTSKTQLVKTTRGTYDGATTLSRGASFPGVNVPNGYLTLTPVSTTNTNKQLYTYISSKIAAFSVTHQASIHCRDYDMFQFMPNTVLNASTADSSALTGDNKAAAFSHDNEVDRPNYYAVTFNSNTNAARVETKLTTTDHAAMAQITFPENASKRNIIFDSINGSDTAEGDITFNNDGTFTAWVNSGHERSLGYVTMYVYGRFSAVPTVTRSVSEDTGLATGIVSFDSAVSTVTLSFATSFISAQQAEKNLTLEIDSADTFEDIVEQSETAWEEILNLIDIKGAYREELINVYSGLYRMYSYPKNYSENTGTADSPKIQYMSPYTKKVTDGQLYVANGFWDTYRTVWPAYSLLTPTKAGELIDGVLQHYRDSQTIPRWINPAGIVCMLGTNSDAILADAAVKGIEFDYELAFESIIKNAATTNSSGVAGRQDQTNALFNGYVTSSVGSSVSWQMENAINDYAAAKFAQLLGKVDYADYLVNRSLTYTNLYEKTSGFFISRSANGTFTASGSNLDPYLWDPNKYGHSEANAWGTAFAATFDGEGLAALYGGKEGLIAKLDGMFAADQECTSNVGTWHEMNEGRECKLGQYWHSNQPAHGNLYLYNIAGQPYKTQAYTREVLDRLYVGSSYGQGYVGDEDNGEQSAWYILSALGFYPLSLGSGNYSITAPLFDEVTLHLESGDIKIVAHNNSSENVYIQSMTIDGVAHDSTEISHDSLIGAKQIEFTMGSTPSDWGCQNNLSGSSLTIASDPVAMTDLTAADCSISASSGVSSLSNLYNNTTAAATLTGETPVVDIKFTKAQTVKMVTLTSSTLSGAPATATVYASKTGAEGSYIQLGSATLAYDFNNQVYPISLDNNTPYSYYRIQFTHQEGNTTSVVAELELLGYTTQTPYGETELNGLVQAADLLMEEMDTTAKNGVMTAYEDAARTLKSTTVTDYNYTTVYNTLRTALLTKVTQQQLNDALTSVGQQPVEPDPDDPSSGDNTSSDDSTSSNDTTSSGGNSSSGGNTSSDNTSSSGGQTDPDYGDVNEDGAVNAGDALEILKYAVGKQELTEEQRLLADVTGDGFINAGDALEVLKYAVGKIDSFSVQRA